MGVDLHAHTTASDGTDSPARLIKLAASLGLSAVAVTDHDTTQGLPEAEEAAFGAGIELVKGVEVSADWRGGAMHMLVLLAEDCDLLHARLREVRRGRTVRNHLMVERLRGQGIPMTMEEVEEEGGQGTIGRPHFASVLVKKGYVSDVGEAFNRYLGRGRSAYVERERLSSSQAIDLAHSVGGVAVLAHPLTIGVEGGELSTLVGDLATLGLDGLEAYYGAYDPTTRENLATLARRHGLVPTGGSDYHGDFKPDIGLGVGRGDLLVPDRVLEELRAAASVPAGRDGDRT
jgi:hypothetical protein